METPLLQIVHYSDLHLAAGDYVQSRWALDQVYPRLSPQHKQGWAGPERAVLEEFLHLIDTLASGEPQWAACPLWLVDTGDGTTFGDDDSLTEWQAWSAWFTMAAQPQGRLMRVYGNHDAWPATFPLLAPGLQWAMDGQRNRLRRDHFPARWPERPWTVPIPGTAGGPGGTPSCIELCAVNTVDHTLVENALALGVAARDHYWTMFQTLPLDTPADDMARQSLAGSGGAAGRHLRIAAMHYPVADHATPGAPPLQKTLFNRARFARDLRRHRKIQPFVADLLLAGHTHQPFPGVGQLPRSASAALHPPLAAGQCQLVSGSLCQKVLPELTLPPGASWAETAAFERPYQCTILRFYSQPHDPYELVMDRMIAGADGLGVFRNLRLAPGSGQTVERMTFRL